MRKDKSILRKNRRFNDFPELQVGFPERNDVSNPDIGMERTQVDLETMGLSKKSAEEVSRTRSPRI